MNLNKILVSVAAVASAFFVGFSPVTVFASSDEKECICEEKCTEDHVNPKCEVCSYDYTFCEGKEKEEWGPLTPDGNLDLVDDYGTLEAGGKQFITVVTKSGNYFYIIIDRDDEGAETVHFLNMVDEADLLALMEEDEVEEYIKNKTDKEEPVKEEKVEPVVEEAPKEDVKPKKNLNGIMAVILVIALAGIGGFGYFKSSFRKKNIPMEPDPDIDYQDEDDSYEEAIEAALQEED